MTRDESSWKHGLAHGSSFPPRPSLQKLPRNNPPRRRRVLNPKQVRDNTVRETNGRLTRLPSAVTRNIRQLSNVPFPGWMHPMETLWQDVQFAVRMMRKNLGFTTAAVLCLMLGIGANTGIFTVVNAVLLQPLPYAHPEQLIRIYTEFPTFPNGGLHRFWTSGPEFLDLRRDTHSWASLDAWITGGANLAGKTQPVRVTAAYLSGGFAPPVIHASRDAQE